MQVSLNWLRDYVDLSGLSVEDICKALTNLGLEVEGVSPVSSLDDKVVCGRVLKAEPHPDADSLQVCQVDVGEKEPLSIVCGAANARAGLSVVVARIGAILPGNFAIKESKIRGQKSFGMLCSEKELELSENHGGIIELPGSPAPGSSATAALDLEDTVIELNVTPNRADCNGYLGIARDLAAHLRKPLMAPKTAVTKSGKLQTSSRVKLSVEDNEACGRFVALCIDDVKTLPSPQWLARRLMATGMRPINLIVDVTNYVMLEYGQPIHAYDKRDLRGDLISVRRANAQEKLKTLDGTEQTLQDHDIVIADRDGAIGLAGVMGGENSEVKDDTDGIVVEVAQFNPVSVRRTARRLGLHTEASHRFERGIDIEVLPEVALRVAHLLQTATAEINKSQGTAHAVPTVANDLLDLYPNKVSPKKIAVRVGRAKEVLGISKLTASDIKEYLEALQFTLLDSNQERLVFEIPAFRGDIVREVDLIEEIGRMAGFDQIPYRLPNMHIRPTPEDPFLDFIDDAKTAMAGLGFHETISFPFVSEADFQNLRLEKGHPLCAHLRLQNPLAEDTSLLHTTLSINLLKAASLNRRRGEQGARLFESGRAFYDFAKFPMAKEHEPLWGDLSRRGRHLKVNLKSEVPRPAERTYLAAVIDQPWVEKHWQGPKQVGDFYTVKNILFNWFKTLGLPAPILTTNRSGTIPFLHPGASALVVGNSGKLYGYFGELHPECAVKLDFPVDQIPLLLEVDLEKAFELKAASAELDVEPCRYPPVHRDLAFIVDRDVSHDAFLAALTAQPKRKHMTGFRLFDVYQGDNLPTGKKSMAFSFAFQSKERTLTDKEVETEIQQIVSHIRQELAAELR